MPKKSSDSLGTIDPKELLIVAHHIKYNLYMLSKATVFAAIMGKSKNLESALAATEKAMQELDLAQKENKAQKD